MWLDVILGHIPNFDEGFVFYSRLFFRGEASTFEDRERLGFFAAPGEADAGARLGLFPGFLGVLKSRTVSFLR